MFRSSNMDFHLDGGFELCCDMFLGHGPVGVEPESQAWRPITSRNDVHNIVVIRKEPSHMHFTKDPWPSHGIDFEKTGDAFWAL